MQPGIFPVLELAVAIQSRAPKMDAHTLVLKEPDVAPDEEMVALCAETRLIERPPLL